MISIDFLKAFNRMNHYRCLEALSDLGAEMTTIDWVASFLYNRRMSVRIGGAMSVPRTAPGGSPQGSILGNFLFCSTTNEFTSLTGESSYMSSDSDSSTSTDMSEPVVIHRVQESTRAPEYVSSTPSTRGQFAQFRPPRNLQNLSGEYESDEESFDFFRVRQRFQFDTSSSASDETQHHLTRVSETNKPVQNYVYIDDFNAIESVDIRDAQAHITTRKCHLDVRVIKFERLFKRINDMATDIGMLVNSEKTQMLCINAAIHNTISTHIKHRDNTIKSTKEMKILGFNFDARPNACGHVEKLIEKFHCRLWTLRF